MNVAGFPEDGRQVCEVSNYLIAPRARQGVCSAPASLFPTFSERTVSHLLPQTQRQV